MKKETESDPLVRKSVTLRRSLWAAVEENMMRNGSASLAEAVRRLLSDALKKDAKR